MNKLEMIEEFERKLMNGEYKHHTPVPYLELKAWEGEVHYVVKWDDDYEIFSEYFKDIFAYTAEKAEETMLDKFDEENPDGEDFEIEYVETRIWNVDNEEEGLFKEWSWSA